MYEYNPIVRTFNQVRAAILAATDTPRCRIRPGATLTSIIPPERRQAVWDELRRRGLGGPGMDQAVVRGCMLVCTVLFWLALLLGWGWFRALLIAPIPLLFALYVVTAPDMTVPRYAPTVGDLTVFCTRFPDHKASGYRWSRGDIALKVRLIIAYHLGVPLERIQEETSFVEDLGAE
jgi:hypothetical protein